MTFSRKQRPPRGLARFDCWLPKDFRSENISSSFVIDLAAHRKRKKQRELRLPPVVMQLRLAETFQTLLAAGEAASRADLARRYRLTRARVTQLMDLLMLPPLLVEYLRTLPVGTPERLVTERKLRRVIRQERGAQGAFAERTVPGFARWMSSRSAA